MKRDNYNKKKCSICGFYTLDKSRPYSICPICYWEDDPIQSKDPSFSGGANKLCLTDYKDNWVQNHNVAVG
jgi:hypothetical protein